MKVIIDDQEYDTGKLRLSTVLIRFLFAGEETKMVIPNLTRITSQMVYKMANNITNEIVDTIKMTVEISRCMKGKDWWVEVAKRVDGGIRQEIRPRGESRDSGTDETGDRLGEGN